MRKSRFLSQISHDIRTPMNAIMGMTTLAMMNINDREKVKDCLDKISISSSHLLGIINKVLDMSEIESGRMGLTEKRFRSERTDEISNGNIFISGRGEKARYKDGC